MRIPSIATLLVLPLVGAVASAADDEIGPWYFEFGTGLDSPADSIGPEGSNIVFDSGYTLNALLGRDMGRLGAERLHWSLEFEGFFSDVEFAKENFASLGSASAEDTSNVALMVNAMLDWRWSEKVSVYGGGGLGYATSVDLDTFGDALSDFDLIDTHAPAMQSKIGLRYRMGGNFSWTLGYRYYQTTDLEVRDDFIGSAFDMENRHHVFEFGVRWDI